MKIHPMNEALELARKAAQEDEVPIGAVVVIGGKIVGRGHNLKETHQNPLLHAEIIAIQEASKQLGTWRLLGAELVSTLEPCPMCLAVSVQARIQKITFGAWDPKGGALSLNYRLDQDPRLNHQIQVNFEESKEASDILKKFFKGKRERASTDD